MKRTLPMWASFKQDVDRYLIDDEVPYIPLPLDIDPWWGVSIRAQKIYEEAAKLRA